MIWCHVQHKPQTKQSHKSINWAYFFSWSFPSAGYPIRIDEIENDIISTKWWCFLRLKWAPIIHSVSTIMKIFVTFLTLNSEHSVRRKLNFYFSLAKIHSEFASIIRSLSVELQDMYYVFEISQCVLNLSDWRMEKYRFSTD